MRRCLISLTYLSCDVICILTFLSSEVKMNCWGIVKLISVPEPLGDNSTFISPLSLGIIIVFGCGLFLISANFLLSSNEMMSANKPFCSGEDISDDRKAMTQIIAVKNTLYTNIEQSAKKVANLLLLSMFS